MKVEFKEIKKFITDFNSYSLSIAIDSGKEAAKGKTNKKWVGTLFIWPFVIVLIIVIYLIVNIFVP